MGLREEKKQATRAAIVETALELFRERGFCDTRIQDIADRLRISEATFFNYFRTKESVLEAVADGLIERSLLLLQREREATGRPVSDRLSEVAGAFADQFDGDPAFVALLAGNTRFFLGTQTDRFDRALGLLTALFVRRAGSWRSAHGHRGVAARGALPVRDVRHDPGLGACRHRRAHAARTAPARRLRADRRVRDVRISRPTRRGA